MTASNCPGFTKSPSFTSTCSSRPWICELAITSLVVTIPFSTMGRGCVTAL